MPQHFVICAVLPKIAVFWSFCVLFVYLFTCNKAENISKGQSTNGNSINTYILVIY